MFAKEVQLLGCIFFLIPRRSFDADARQRLFLISIKHKVV